MKPLFLCGSLLTNEHSKGVFFLIFEEIRTENEIRADQQPTFYQKSQKVYGSNEAKAYCGL